MGSNYAILLLSILLTVVNGVPLSNFYNYGPNVDTIFQLNPEDIQTEISLITPIKFFDETYYGIFVNEYGCLSFRAQMPQFISIPFPLDYPTIAALYSNVDTKGTGTIYYRETQDEALLKRANSEISKSFPRFGNDFKAKSLFIATWVEVGYFERKTDKVNTFQIVVISNGEESFVEFFYADGGIQWLQGDHTRFPDAKAQVGLMQDGVLYNIPHSGSDQVHHLDKISNTDTPGVWIFRVGNLDNLGKIEAPEVYISNEITSCSSGGSECHSKAECVDDVSDHCCICKEGYYGNGINCLPDGAPLRINGKLSFDVNGVQANNLVLQSYIAVDQGRSYSAVTKLPLNIGSTLQLASLFTNSIGWLFAKSINTPNGYHLTGGVFNYSADLIFPTGQRLTIQEQFFGHDVFDQLKMEVSIKGSVPNVAFGAKLQLDDLQQEFTHSWKGMLQSQSSHTYRIEGDSSHEVNVRIVQNIHFNEGCESQSKNITNTKMKGTKNLIVYEARENILRIGSTNKISTNNLNSDPCLNFYCVANSSCIVEQDRPTCICNRGFQQVYSDDGQGEDLGCFDINECNDGEDRCHANALCINEIATYSCQCKPGYSGNGYDCIELNGPQSPSVSPCEHNPQACYPPHSTCSNPSDYTSCSCDPGFQTDYKDHGPYAFVCTDLDECLNYPSVCNDNADCINLPGTYECRCRPGFIGDGVDCDVDESISPAAATCDRVTCQENAECIEDPSTGPHCDCSPGYKNTDSVCVLIKSTCDYHADCSTHAKCIYNRDAATALCVCLEGYEGDGYNCEYIKPNVEKNSTENVCAPGDQHCVAEDEDLCLMLVCHDHAFCKYEGGVAVCVCNSGYSGNGTYCDLLSNPNEDQPEPNPISLNEDGQETCLMLVCHDHASCKYEAGVAVCVCDSGYTGDGKTCYPNSTPAFDTIPCTERDVPSTRINEKGFTEYFFESTTSTQCGRNAYCTENVDTHLFECVCHEGFYRDGDLCLSYKPDDSLDSVPCTERDVPSTRINEKGFTEYFFESTTSTQCGRNAYCTENVDTHLFECVCHEGFYRDGDLCLSYKPDDSLDSDCETPCHANAQCSSSDDLESQGKCKCNIGYSGDGVNECNLESLGCNVVRNCHENAECVYNDTSAGYRCQCTQGYVGNGIECHPEATCMEDNTLCHKYASCILATQGHYHCTCNEGFTGNGIQCEPVHKKISDFLLVNQGMAMIKVPYNPTRNDPGRPIHIEPNQILIGIAIDCIKGQVYWGAAGKSSIKRSYYDGKNIEDVITENIQSPEGLTLDWLNRAIYWTDSGLHSISMANLDTKQTVIIASKDLVNPRGIAVHPYYRKLFWSDWNRVSPKIEWSNLDGSDREIFLQSQDLILPNSLAIDFSTDELCWVDADIKSVECVNIRSRYRRKIYSNCTYPFGLTITQDKYYWTEWKTDRIESANKDGTKAQSINLPLIGSTYLYGIVAVPNKCP